MLRLAICDDDVSVIEQLEEYIERTNKICFDYETFFSANELYNYKKRQQIDFDVYILDIEMKGMSGLDLAKKLRAESPFAVFVFLTSYSQYVYDVFEVVVFDFILKPLTYDRFIKTIKNIQNYFDMTKMKFVFSYRKNNFSILAQSINYIEKSGRKAFIHVKEDEVYQCNITIEQIWEQLNPKMFVAIYASCIVNLDEIKEIVRDELILRNGDTLYIGRQYRKKVKLQHLQFLKEQL